MALRDLWLAEDAFERERVNDFTKVTIDSGAGWACVYYAGTDIPVPWVRSKACGRAMFGNEGQARAWAEANDYTVLTR